MSMNYLSKGVNVAAPERGELRMSSARLLVLAAAVHAAGSSSVAALSS